MYEVYIAIISFLIGAFAMFVYIAISASLKEDKSNKVHFYVTRNKYKNLCLFLGKPIRCEDQGVFIPQKHGCSMSYNSFLKDFGLNIDDYKNLTWNDEPVEVFLNLED